MDGYSLVYLKTSFFVIIPRRRPLWVTRVWEEFFTDYDMKASHISWYQSILQPPTCRRPSLRNMSTTVSMGVWKGRHWYKVLGCKTLSCHSLESDLDLVGDSDWGKIDNLPQLDRRRAASYHWHVVGENTKAGGKSFLIPRLKRIIDPIHHHLWWIWDIKIGSYKAKKKTPRLKMILSLPSSWERVQARPGVINRQKKVTTKDKSNQVLRFSGR